MKQLFFTLVIVLSIYIIADAQHTTPYLGEIHGNFQMDVQYYKADSVIGAPAVSEKVLTNGFSNIIYSFGKFSAGLRYESYLNPILGFDARNKGTGIPYRYASYNSDELDVTIGNFYEQFGNGLVLRTYEDKGLGFDNCLDGIRAKYIIHKGIILKGLIGKQRFFFEKGPGIVRGLDGEISFNDLINYLEQSKTRITIGGSFVSKFQHDEDPVYKLPENVAAWAGRLNITNGKFGFAGEYAYKINDPSTTNNFIYKPGEVLLLTTSYAEKGFGITISAKRIDNFGFRSDRTITGNSLTINYLPALSKQHTYALSAMYPYASQANGEMAFQGDAIYNFKKGSKIGGKYGTTIALNYSRVNAIDRTKVNDTTEIMQNGTLGYKSKFFTIGKEQYFQDFNVEISRKFSQKLKLIISYVNLSYNKDIAQGLKEYGTVYANIGIIDITYRFLPKHALRMELQGLYTRQDYKNWAMGLLEYTIAPRWFFTVYDQYNYGNPHKEKQIHYYAASIGYTKKANRFQLSYGRQREGIVCVGGVCRNVPASNGITFSVTSSF